MISCWNDYLRWYHLDLDEMGKDLLENMKATFLHFAEKTDKSVWCTEKIHSILHANENIKLSGRSWNSDTQVTEMKHKTIKVKAKNTNNQHTFGLSLLLSEMRADAVKALAIRLAVSLGKRGEGHIYSDNSDIVATCRHRRNLSSPSGTCRHRAEPQAVVTGRNLSSPVGTCRHWPELLHLDL